MSCRHISRISFGETKCFQSIKNSRNCISQRHVIEINQLCFNHRSVKNLPIIMFQNIWKLTFLSFNKTKVFQWTDKIIRIGKNESIYLAIFLIKLLLPLCVQRSLFINSIFFHLKFIAISKHKFASSFSVIQCFGCFFLATKKSCLKL